MPALTRADCNVDHIVIGAVNHDLVLIVFSLEYCMHVLKCVVLIMK